MSLRRAHAAAWALLLACAPAAADITLSGVQHIGDCKPKGASCAAFTQNDPVTRDFMFSKPINFHVSGLVMLDKVQLNGPEDLGNQLQIYLETPGTTFVSSHFGVLSGDTFDLIPDIPLTAGYYVLLPDGGCTVNNNEASPNGFYSGCSGGEDNDFGFASITLVTADASTSVMFNGRLHIGDSSESTGSGTVAYAGRWYPDPPDGLSTNLSFTLGANQRLTSVEFYRLRDVGAGLQRASVSVDGITIGSLTTDSVQPNSAPINTNLLLLAGSHTLRIEMPDPGDADDISWDDIVLRFSDAVSAGVPGFFNAVDTGESNVLGGPLRTKIAGGTPSIEVVAINPLGTGVNTTYTGTVEVTLLDATSSSGVLDAFGCDVLWSSTGFSTAVTFAAGNGGRVAMPAPFFDRALRRAVLKLRDTTTNATGCSTDTFALRPARFTLVASHDTELLAGTTEALGNTSTGGLPRHRAGQPFTLQATAVNAADLPIATYDGTPENTVTSTAIAPATVSAAASIGIGGWTVSGAVRSSNEARYPEAGAVTLEVKDTTFADADVADTTLANRTISGSYAAGRFVPDHFDVANATVNPGCGAAFTYFGQSVSFPAAAVTLTAHDASHAQTRNYDGALYNLPATVGQAAFTPYQVGGVPQLSVPAGSHALTNVGSGVATLALPAITVVRPSAPTGPLDLDFAVTLPAFTDADGIAPEASPIVIGSAAAGSGVAFVGNAKQLRYGRLQLQAVFGSERMPLDVPLRAEYFDGVSFVPNTADACTLAITDPNAALSNPAFGQTHTVASLGNGLWRVRLTAPGDSRQVGVNMNLLGTPALSPPGAALAYPWLRPDSDGNGTYDNNPTTTATFGLYSGEDRRIYQREVVGSN